METLVGCGLELAHPRKHQPAITEPSSHDTKWPDIQSLLLLRHRTSDSLVALEPTVKVRAPRRLKSVWLVHVSSMQATRLSLVQSIFTVTAVLSLVDEQLNQGSRPKIASTIACSDGKWDEECDLSSPIEAPSLPFISKQRKQRDQGLTCEMMSRNPVMAARSSSHRDLRLPRPTKWSLGGQPRS